MKVLLVNGNRTDGPNLPVGLGYIAQALFDAGVNYCVADVVLDTEESIVNQAAEQAPDFVAIGSMSYEISKNYDLLVKIKDVLPDVKIIVGGPCVIAEMHKIFEDCPIIDYAVAGEGENAILNILRGIKDSAVLYGTPMQGLEGNVVVLSTEPYRAVLDDISYPRYFGFDLDRYGNEINIASSRGCPYKCTFCGAPKFLGRKWRHISAERMFEEFMYWYQKGYKRFYFSDSLLLAKKKRIIDFCNLIINERLDPVVFRADGIRVDNVSQEVLEKMREAGFTRLVFGVESASNEVLEFYLKGQTLSHTEQALSIADNLGFDIQIYIIIGAPNETYEMAKNSIWYAKKYRNISSVIVSKLLPIPGTPYFDYYSVNVDPSIKLSTSHHYEAYSYNASTVLGFKSDELWSSVQEELEKAMRFYQVRRRINSYFSKTRNSSFYLLMLNNFSMFFSSKYLYAVLSTFLKYRNRARLRFVNMRLPRKSAL